MESIDIAPGGDLILVVNNAIELRVFSFLLRVISKPFAAMLGPNFAEGQTQGSAANPKRVHLPDDDPEGMKLLCLILHHQNDHLHEIPTSSAIEGLAIAADKYDCITQIRLAVEAWLSRINITSTGNPGALLHAVYILNAAISFYNFTFNLIGDSGNIAHWPKTTHEITNNIQDTLQERSTQIRKTLDEDLVRIVDGVTTNLGPEAEHYLNNFPGIDPPEDDDDDDDWVAMDDGGKPQKCKYFEEQSTLHLKALAASRIWPPSRQRYGMKNLVDDILACEKPNSKSVKYCYPGEGDPCTELFSDSNIPSEFNYALDWMQRTAKKVEFGLCLDCFRAEGGVYQGKCRVEHKDKKTKKNIKEKKKKTSR